VTWTLGGPNDARFRVHVLPEGDSEAIVAQAPGLYPANRNTSYLLSRRRGENLRSAFVSVMEPYAVSLPGDALDAKTLLELMTAHSREVKLLSEYGVVLHKGQQAGDQMTFRVDVKEAGPHEIAALMLQAPSYGIVRLLVDGQPLGEPFRGAASAVTGPQLVVFGRRDLAAGPHDLRFEMTAEGSQCFISVGSLIIRPAGAEGLQPLKPQPVLSAVERLAVKGPSDAMVPLGVRVRRGDVDEILVSADLASKGNSVATPVGELKWDGAVVYLRLKQGKLVAFGSHGAGPVTLGQTKLIAGPPAHIGKVVAANYEEHWVEVEAGTPLPATGLEGEPAVFSSPRYTRTTAYRIAKISPAARGLAAPRVRIEFGDQAMRLGQGRVHQIPDEHTILTDIPHDYAKSVIGGADDGFFNGKLLQGESGAKTFLRAVEFDTPMKLRVESSAGFSEGEVLHYCDLAVGDTVTIPTSTWKAFPR
jgi:hypothetical protein